MTVLELRDRLSAYPSYMTVTILDGFNGGGLPRDITLGPTLRTLDKDDCEDNSDMEGRAGDTVVAIGFGCY